MGRTVECEGDPRCVTRALEPIRTEKMNEGVAALLETRPQPETPIGDEAWAK